MKNYQVKNGPVSLPASLYGTGRILKDGDTFTSTPNSWLRRALARKRIAAVADVKAAATPTSKPRKERKSDA